VTFYEAAVRARALLIEARIPPEVATLDADLLARHALGWDLATWLTHRSEPATAPFLATYEALVARRVAREPVAYIRGIQEFWGREFLVSPAVLIPRPETELIVELASDYLRSRPGAVVVDVGTGTGCIAITLALEHADASVHATDISREALDVARANAQRLHADGRVRFIHGAHLTGAPRPIDLLLANPPYVAERDRPALAPEVREHEPAVALYGGPDGWREIRHLLQQAAAALAPGGLFLMELGYGQSDRLPAEIAASGLQLDRLADDLQGVPRVAVFRTKNEERRTKN
jgi:release factor glutamine methyltransferase